MIHIYDYFCVYIYIHHMTCNPIQKASCTVKHSKATAEKKKWPVVASSVVFSTSSISRRMTPLSKSRWPLQALSVCTTTLCQNILGYPGNNAPKRGHKPQQASNSCSGGSLTWGANWSRVECCRMSAKMSTPLEGKCPISFQKTIWQAK